MYKKTIKYTGNHDIIGANCGSWKETAESTRNYYNSSELQYSQSGEVQIHERRIQIIRETGYNTSNQKSPTKIPVLGSETRSRQRPTLRVLAVLVASDDEDVNEDEDSYVYGDSYDDGSSHEDSDSYKDIDT